MVTTSPVLNQPSAVHRFVALVAQVRRRRPRGRAPRARPWSRRPRGGCARPRRRGACSTNGHRVALRGAQSELCSCVARAQAALDAARWCRGGSSRSSPSACITSRPWRFWKPSISAGGAAEPPMTMVRIAERSQRLGSLIEERQDAEPDGGHAAGEGHLLARPSGRAASAGRGAGPGKTSLAPARTPRTAGPRRWRGTSGTTGRTVSSSLTASVSAMHAAIEWSTRGAVAVDDALGVPRGAGGVADHRRLPLVELRGRRTRSDSRCEQLLVVERRCRGAAPARGQRPSSKTTTFSKQRAVCERPGRAAGASGRRRGSGPPRGWRCTRSRSGGAAGSACAARRPWSGRRSRARGGGCGSTPAWPRGRPAARPDERARWRGARCA